MIQKNIWTEADFEAMRWRDVMIYQMALKGDLELDIDYIFSRQEPAVKGMQPTYQIAPCTLVFKQVRELQFDFDVVRSEAFRIDYIERNEHWILVTKNGDMQFNCEGFEMYVRQEPTLQYQSNIGWDRNGYSLERTTAQPNAYLQHEEYLAKRKRLSELYEVSLKRWQKQLELDALEERRESGELDTPTFLQLKKELTQAIEGYKYWLKGTIFDYL